MEQESFWVQIAGYSNGAYPIVEYKGILTDRNSVLLSQNIGKSIPVVRHGKNYFKTTKDCSHFFLIHEKDCILLPS
jgi:hypothetical protein